MLSINYKFHFLGTPSRTLPFSPIGSSASSWLAKRHCIISSSRFDALKAFPTELSQQIFSRLPTRDLAICALVCKKWAHCQSLNYGKLFITGSSIIEGRIFTMRVYLLVNRKWTKRKCKQNWVCLLFCFNCYISAPNLP